MNTSETSKTDFDNKVSILYELWYKHKEEDIFSGFISQNSLAIYYCVGLTFGHIDVNSKGSLIINQAFSDLLRLLSTEDYVDEEEDIDQGFASLEDILNIL